jgi:hypothetical protein
LKGLVNPLQYQLMNHTFPTFQHLIDRAIMIEKKRKEMEDPARLVDLSLGATIAPVSQATHISGSSRISACLISRFRGSTLSISNSVARTVSQEEVNSRGRISVHLVFLTQQLTKAIKQPQCKAKAEHVSSGEQGHWVMHCPKKVAQQQPGPSAPAKLNVSQLGAGNRTQTRYNHGRLNHLKAEAV